MYVVGYDGHFARTCGASKGEQGSSNQCQETNSDEDEGDAGYLPSSFAWNIRSPLRAHTIVRGVVVKFQFSHIAISTAGGSDVSSQIRPLPYAHPVYDNAVRSHKVVDRYRGGVVQSSVSERELKTRIMKGKIAGKREAKDGVLIL